MDMAQCLVPRALNVLLAATRFPEGPFVLEDSCLMQDWVILAEGCILPISAALSFERLRLRVIVPHQ